MSDTHKQTLQAANSAIAKGDYDGFLAHCTEDTQWHLISEGDWLSALVPE